MSSVSYESMMNIIAGDALTAKSIRYICKYGSIDDIRGTFVSARANNICHILISEKRFDVLDEVWRSVGHDNTSVVESFIKVLGIGYKLVDGVFVEVTEYDEEIFKIFVHFLTSLYSPGFLSLSGYGPNVLKKIARDYAEVKTSNSWPFIGDDSCKTNYVTCNTFFNDAVANTVAHEKDIAVVEELLSICPKICTSKKHMMQVIINAINRHNVVVFNHIADRYGDVIEWRNVINFGNKLPTGIIEKLYDMDIGKNQKRNICKNIIRDGCMSGLNIIAKRPILSCSEANRVHPDVWNYNFVKRVVDLGFTGYIDDSHTVSLELLTKDINEGRMPYATWMDNKFRCHEGYWIARRIKTALRMSDIIARYRERMIIPALIGPRDVSIICMA